MKRMHKWMASLGLSLGLVQALQAEPAVYRDDSLHIREGVVIGIEGRAFYYQDIWMGQAEDGSLEVLAAEPLPLVAVESAEVSWMEQTPGQATVLVAGFKSTPCVSLTSPGISYQDGLFHVVIGERPAPEDQVCAQVLEPFELEVSLSLEDLAPGEYWVDVNNSVEVSFQLPAAD